MDTIVYKPIITKIGIGKMVQVGTTQEVLVTGIIEEITDETFTVMYRKIVSMRSSPAGEIEDVIQTCRCHIKFEDVTGFMEIS